MSDDDGFLPPHGNYAELLSFQKAEIVYDLTFRFAHKYLSKGDRTIDQMIQSARSGKKNILEGSKASVTSKEMEIKLTGVARASLEELLDDYKDYLRARDLPIWEKDSKEAQYVRRFGRKNPQTFEDYREFFETRPPEVMANIALCLIHQANYLLDRQIRRLEKDFLKEGGLRERMTRARLQHRNRPHESNESNESHEPHESQRPPPRKPPPAMIAPASRISKAGGRSANGAPPSQPRAEAAEGNSGRRRVGEQTPWERRFPRASGRKARDIRCAVVPGFQPSRFFGSGTQGVALGWLRAGASPLGRATGAALNAESAEVLETTRGLP